MPADRLVSMLLDRSGTSFRSLLDGTPSAPSRQAQPA
jgi:hypothetical protein